MFNCSNCGSYNPTGSKFCTNCGNKLNATSDKQYKTTKIEVEPETSIKSTNNTETNQSVNETKLNHSTNKTKSKQSNNHSLIFFLYVF